MKVSQLRQVLEAAARQHQQLANADIGIALLKLSNALKSQDKFEVSKLIKKLQG